MHVFIYTEVFIIIIIIIIIIMLQGKTIVLDDCITVLDVKAKIQNK